MKYAFEMESVTMIYSYEYIKVSYRLVQALKSY
jgi:hypothetical protein